MFKLVLVLLMFEQIVGFKLVNRWMMNRASKYNHLALLDSKLKLDTF